MQYNALAPVDGITSSLRKSLVRVSLSQADDSCWKAKSQRIEKMHQRLAVLQLILYSEIKGGDVRRVT